MKHASFIAAAAAVALLGFAAPANATHVQCGDTITQNTTLDSDVVCPPNVETQAGITIGASNITLNLGGHAIQSPDLSGTYGVRTPPFQTLSGIHVRGGASGTGRIEGFFFGIAATATDSSFRGLAITATGKGIELIDGHRAVVMRNVIGLMEEEPTGDAIEVTGGDGVLITRNTITGNPEFGISVAAGGLSLSADHPRVSVNTVEGCGIVGILIRGYTDSAVVARNEVTGCVLGSGISVATDQGGSTGGAQVRRNRATGHRDIGIEVGDPNAFVWCNTANGNGDGISLAGGPSTRVEENTANNNLGNGIFIEAPGTVDGGGNAAAGNGVDDCPFNMVCGTTSTCTRSVGAG